MQYFDSFFSSKVYTDLKKEYTMKPLVKFIITALIIIAGAMAFQAYKHGAFENGRAHTPEIPKPANSH